MDEADEVSCTFSEKKVSEVPGLGELGVLWNGGPERGHILGAGHCHTGEQMGHALYITDWYTEEVFCINLKLPWKLCSIGLFLMIVDFSEI